MLVVGLGFGFQFPFSGFDRAPVVVDDESDLTGHSVEVPDVFERHVQIVGCHAGVIRFIHRYQQLNYRLTWPTTAWL